MRLSFVAVCMGLAVGCATKGVPAPTSADIKPSILNLSADPDTKAPKIIDQSTRELALRVHVGSPPYSPLSYRFRVDRKLVAPARVRLRLELADLPVEIEGQKLEDGLWEISVPPNVIQLLRSESGTATYFGRLVLDNERQKSLPAKLVLQGRKSADRMARGSSKRPSAAG